MDKNEINTESKDDNKRASQATQIVSMIQASEIELFHDQYDEPFARFKQGDRFEYCKIRSNKFKRWVCNKYWNLFSQVPNKEALNSALIIIEAKACFDGKKYMLNNRIAFYEDSIYYDLGNWTAVKINKSGWEIELEPPILFRSYNHQKIQVTPEKCEEGAESKILDKLLTLINIKESNQKLLFLINLICIFIPNIPRPIFVLYGVQGTAKTTISSFIKQLVDPSELKNLRIGNSYVEFIQQADHHHILVLDKLTTLPTWMSDGLC